MNTNALESLFSDERYVRDELLRIRECFGDRTKFTFDFIDAARRTLAFAVMYAPENMQSLINAHLAELDMRERLSLWILPPAPEEV